MTTYREIYCYIVIAIAIGFIYIFNFHRISSYQDIYKIIDISTKSNLENNRCKHYNASHVVCLPNLFFIGSSKCGKLYYCVIDLLLRVFQSLGTTTVAGILSTLPNIYFVRRRIHPKDHHKEIHRFDRNTYHFSNKWIELHEEWASCPIIENADNTSIIHYTPNYLYAPSVPFELKTLHPSFENDSKFFIMIRDPIERAWSSYWFHNSHLINGRDKGSVQEFRSLVIKEIQSRSTYDLCMKETFSLSYLTDREIVSAVKSSQVDRLNYFQALKTCFGDKFRSPTLGKRHLDKGIYIDQFIRWFSLFSRERFHVMKYENWKTNPRLEIINLLSFLEVPIPSSVSNESSFHQLLVLNTRLIKPNSLSRNTSIPMDLREIMADFYYSYNVRLNALLHVI